VYGDSTWPALSLGTENAVYVEDNVMSGQRHHIASNNSSRYVFRYNKVNATDASKDFAMTDAHGKNSWPTGSRSYEIYNNTYTATLTSGKVNSAITIRGGDGVIFNNTVASNIQRPVALQIENSPTVSCGTANIPGKITDLWIWNNAPSSVTNDCTASIRLNIDYRIASKIDAGSYRPFTYPHPLRSQ
jgi:hypothetical protein